MEVRRGGKKKRYTQEAPRKIRLLSKRNNYPLDDVIKSQKQKRRILKTINPTPGAPNLKITSTKKKGDKV